MRRSKALKIILSIVTACFLILSLVGCSGKNSQNQNTDASLKEVKGLEEAFAEQPIILTSCGQSADVYMIKTLLEKIELDCKIETALNDGELGNEKTLVIVIGGSSKGLGAAGIKPEEELKRIDDVISKAKELDMKIISLHIGGENRRGELSDKFINVAAPKSDYIIVVEEGNSDGLFTQIASSNNIQMDMVKAIAEVTEPLKKAFK